MFKNLYTLLTLSGLAFIVTWSCSTTQSQNCNPNIKDNYDAIRDLKFNKQWGVYNLHDPSCIKAGKYYYCYSTDAIFWPEGGPQKNDTIKVGNIMVRRSKDLVKWEFMGWAFDSIPAEAVEHVKSTSGGKMPNGIWAPYILKHNNEFRLYFSVSAFGENTSYIGLATSQSPDGPWKQQGCVVKTSNADSMNAIDPTVVTDASNGKQWMIYGSYFAGIHCLELNSKSGLAKTTGDKGHCVAKRAQGETRIIEAPEVIYNPSLKKYFLFVSYDALFTHYNVRVGRADKPEGPYYDINGVNMAERINSYPVLTYAYRFNNHPGWAGVGHCSVINDNGKFFMLHQGRLAPDNLMMVLHVREIFWTSNGWPVVSPERFAGCSGGSFTTEDIIGKWENIQIAEIPDAVRLWQGQIPFGGWKYDTLQFNNPKIIEFMSDGSVRDQPYLKWNLQKNKLTIKEDSTNQTVELIVSHQWDWENSCPTICFTGLTSSGNSSWGKKAAVK